VREVLSRRTPDFAQDRRQLFWHAQGKMMVRRPKHVRVASGSFLLSPVLGWHEIGVLVLDLGVDVAERGGDLHAWTNRETETVGLADIVVGVLANDDDTDKGEWGVARPRVNVAGWEGK
jgi:hypothetical protein